MRPPLRVQKVLAASVACVPMRRWVATTVVLGCLLAACGGGGSPSSTLAQRGERPPAQAVPPSVVPTAPPPTTPAYPVAEVALAEVARVEVFEAPDAAEAVKTFVNPDPYYGTTRVFLVRENRGDWLDVYLPARPNGSTGWIKRSDVTLEKHDFRILVELGARQITVYEKDKVIMQEPVGVGRSATPTTTGLFYTSVRVQVLPEQQSAYGPWAYGLSGYSEVLYSFGGGDGQMGIHGTGDPSSVGGDVSNGCIRMTNEAITRLVEMLPPVGVPVEIRA